MTEGLTVCVVNFNGRAVLATTLGAVHDLTPRPVAIILVDNASTDGSVELVRAQYPDVQVIQLPANEGPGPAREAAFRAANTPLVGFVDNDVTPAPDCFARLAAALEAADRAALAMPRVVHAETRHHSVRGCPRPLHRPHGPRSRRNPGRPPRRR